MKHRALLLAVAMGCRAATADAVDPVVPAEVRQEGLLLRAPPVVDGEALVLVYDEPPGAEAAVVRFVLFADGHVLWQRPDDRPERWLTAPLDPRATAALVASVEAATRDAPPIVHCDGAGVRTTILVRTAARLRAHVVVAADMCDGNPSAARRMGGVRTVLERIATFDAPDRASFYVVEQQLPGAAQIAAMRQARQDQELAEDCTARAHRLLQCLDHLAPLDPRAEQCRELAHAATDATVCRELAVDDQVCAPSYARGCLHLGDPDDRQG